MKCNMRRVLVSVLILVQATFGFAQYTEKIVSGRPGQAIASQTPGKNVFQLETGFDHAGANWTGFGNIDQPIGMNKRALLNATLLRFGIFNKLEIHSGWEFRQDNWATDEGGSRFTSGMSFSSFGIRHNLIEGDGKKPSFAYQVSAKLNILADEYNDNSVQPHFIITSGMSLTDNLGLTLNTGMDFVDVGSNSWIYIINLGYSLGDNLFTFVEMYGSHRTSQMIIGPNNFAPKFDAGFGYFLNNDIQLDVLGGYAMVYDVEEYFVSIGLSWRINHPEEMPTE